MGLFTASLLAGSAAGTAVDVLLFPLDTIKTRLQSSGGFWKSGGFGGIYKGIGPAFLGSAPNAAIFFATYDFSKTFLEAKLEIYDSPFIHMSAASLGEISACLVRVPVEIVKQRRQVSGDHKNVRLIISQIIKNEGFKGFYRGYLTTIYREIPFSVIQFPLWEFFKAQILKRNGSVRPLESALCGALAGGISAAATTPLDVAKTRIMLAETSSVESQGHIKVVLKIVYEQKGIKGLFAGVLPRTLWISIGGSIFFGTYELVKQHLS